MTAVHQPPWARHQLRMAQHRPAELLEIGLGAGAEMGEQQGHLGQLQLQGGRSAVVASRHQLGGGKRQYLIEERA